VGRRYDTVSFLSDYGTDDEFVGVVKAVIRDLAPHVAVIDLTHAIAPHDVRGGGLALVRCVQYLPTGVVLAVVDPGVGTDRKAVAIEVQGGEGVLVGPDNGLLAPAVAMLGGAERVVSLTNTEYQLPSPGPTFAGRDVLAPAAGHLAAGVPLSDLGETAEAAGLVPGLVSLPQPDEGGGIAGEVWWIDRFGNCQLNIDPEEIVAQGAAPGAPLQVRFRDEVRSARWVETYAAAKPSELVLVVDSYGLTSLALDRQSAAAVCGLKVGSAVTLVPPGAGQE
jgi:S-adenosylmethionine hydrolase